MGSVMCEVGSVQCIMKCQILSQTFGVDEDNENENEPKK